MNRCSNCNAETKNNKFCSRRCAAIVNNSLTPKRKRVGEDSRCCQYCHSVTKPYKKYCSRSCFQAARQVEWIDKWLKNEVDGVWTYGKTCGRIKRWLRETYGDKCSQCGWAEVHPVTGNVPVELDHIDGDFMNNRPENLRLLCPNCHSLTPWHGSLNNGRGRSTRLK